MCKNGIFLANLGIHLKKEESLSFGDDGWNWIFQGNTFQDRFIENLKVASKNENINWYLVA